MTRGATWYVRRLRGMSPGEVVHRVRDRERQLRWSRRRIRVGAPIPPPDAVGDRTFRATLPPGTRARVPEAARQALVGAAERMLAGEFALLGVTRTDMAEPDWFLDPVTGRRAPQDVSAFRVDHRDEGVTGNVKQVWELSRHHHLTVLAAAWWLTGEERYAELVATQLRSWWRENPFLSGIHWTSGIELGVRLTSWVWVRRLLDGWPGAAGLFEDAPEAVQQIRWHLEYLAAFRSRGSSANNHLVAEAAGLLVGACAFPWYAESRDWQRDGAAALEAALDDNVFPSGLNREQASDYHRFVTELGLVALAESDRAGRSLSARTRELLVSSLDAAAAVLDSRGGPPRQGDGDEGRALVLDAPEADPWAELLAVGAAVAGPLEWWPSVTPGVASTLIGGLALPVASEGRPVKRPDAFRDAGLYLLRTDPSDGPEIWCRCDGGPHGFLSIAAHAHADALSVEVRCDGVEILADPGTYCYHGEPEWRDHFRSTLAHNTVEVDGADQSVSGGPFLWSTRTDAVVERAELGSGARIWTGHHSGYARLDPELRHERTVTLDPVERTLTIGDALTGSAPHTLRLALTLGPAVEVELRDGAAALSWDGPTGLVEGSLRLPERLSWSVHRGETSPVLGWYSPRFGQRVPTAVLVGSGAWEGVLSLTTVLDLSRARHADPTGVGDRAQQGA